MWFFLASSLVDLFSNVFLCFLFLFFCWFEQMKMRKKMIEQTTEKWLFRCWILKNLHANDLTPIAGDYAFWLMPKRLLLLKLVELGPFYGLSCNKKNIFQKISKNLKKILNYYVFFMKHELNFFIESYDRYFYLNKLIMNTCFCDFWQPCLFIVNSIDKKQ